MAVDVIMPQMGESITEGTISRWFKQVGDVVKRDENLYEISTDKVDAEIPSPAAGVLLEILFESGQTVAIDTIVARIGEASEATSGPTQGPSSAAPVKAADDTQPSRANPQAAPAPIHAGADAPTSDRHTQPKSSPVVRKIAKEHDIDIVQISGTGTGGRITKKDILAFIEVDAARPKSSPPVSSAVGSEVIQGATQIPAHFRPRVMDGDRTEQLSPMRARIAEHMVLSKRISSHVATVWEVDFSKVATLRQRHKAEWAKKHGINLTYTAFIQSALIRALSDFPVLNASLDGDRAIYHRDINLGLAVALDWGLLVPVIRGAGELNMLGLARRAQDLAERARTKKLKPEEVQDGTFTLTNPGVFGPMFGIPVINQPQAAILGVGAIEKRPVVIDDMIAIRTRAYLSLSFDHRLIDGADADKFMAQLKADIENFDETAV